MNPLLRSIPFTSHYTVTSQIDLWCKLVDCSYIVDKHLRVNNNCNNFYLFATSTCGYNHMPVSSDLDFEIFCVWFIFDRVWNLMWMVVLLSNSASFSRFKFSSLYTIWRALFRIWFVLLFSVLLQNIQARQQ